MELSVIRIGNSKGIRIPKSVLERYHITEKVDLDFQDGFIILKPAQHPRTGWEDAFEEMNKNGDDELLIDDFFVDETIEE